MWGRSELGDSCSEPIRCVVGGVMWTDQQKRGKQCEEKQIMRYKMKESYLVTNWIVWGRRNKLGRSQKGQPGSVGPVKGFTQLLLLIAGPIWLQSPHSTSLPIGSLQLGPKLLFLLQYSKFSWKFVLCWLPWRWRQQTPSEFKEQLTNEQGIIYQHQVICNMEIFEVRRTCYGKLLISWKNGRILHKISIRIAGVWGRLQQGTSYSKIRHINTLRTGAFKLFKRPFPGFNPLTSTFIRCFFKNL